MENGKHALEKVTGSASDSSLVNSLITALRACKSGEECKGALKAFESYLRKDPELAALLALEPSKLPQASLDLLADYSKRYSNESVTGPSKGSANWAHGHTMSPSFHLSPLLPTAQFFNPDGIDPIPPLPIDPDSCGELKSEMKKIFYGHGIDFLANGRFFPPIVHQNSLTNNPFLNRRRYWLGWSEHFSSALCSCGTPSGRSTVGFAFILSYTTHFPSPYRTSILS